MQDITINWRSVSKPAQGGQEMRVVMQKQQQVPQADTHEMTLALIRQEAARLVACLPENSCEATQVLKANSAVIHELYERCATVSENAASTMTSIMNEALAGKHVVNVIDARSKAAPAIAWKNNATCFMVVDPSFLHTDGKGGYFAVNTA